MVAGRTGVSSLEGLDRLAPYFLNHCLTVKDPAVRDTKELAAWEQAVAHQPGQSSAGVFPVAIDGIDCSVLPRQELFLHQISSLLAEKSLAEKEEKL